jgi:hypothetical protein
VCGYWLHYSVCYRALLSIEKLNLFQCALHSALNKSLIRFVIYSFRRNRIRVNATEDKLSSVHSAFCFNILAGTRWRIPERLFVSNFRMRNQRDRGNKVYFFISVVPYCRLRNSIYFNGALHSALYCRCRGFYHVSYRRSDLF